MYKRLIREFFIITIGTIIIAAAVFFFMLPGHIAIGSGTALAMMLSSFIPLPVSMMSMILNIVLLIIGFLLVGREFGVKTVYCSLLMPLVMYVFEQLFPDFQSLTQDLFLDMLAYIMVVGVGLAIVFSYNASSGGVDIIAKIMNKYLHMELGRASGIAGFVISLSSIFFYDAKTAVVSVIGTYLGGIVIDHFIFGMNVKRRVCIISNEHDKIVDFILHQMHSGATIYEIIGAYNNTPRKEIITIVDKQEYKRLMDYMRVTDPRAFITVYSVGEIKYVPKPTGRR